MAYTDIYDQAVAAATTLKKKTAVALHKAAVDIINEDAGTALHNDRLTLANRIVSSPAAWADKVIWKVMENATIAADPGAATDSDVQFVVNSMINTILHMQ